MKSKLYLSLSLTIIVQGEAGGEQEVSVLPEASQHQPDQGKYKLLFTEISLTYPEDQGKYKLLFTEMSLTYPEDQGKYKILFTEISLTYQEDQGKYKLLVTEMSLTYQEDHVAAANRKFLKVQYRYTGTVWIIHILQVVDSKKL